MDQGWATRINLIEFLEEQHPEAPLLPDDTASYWDEAQIRAYFQLPREIRKKIHLSRLQQNDLTT